MTSPRLKSLVVRDFRSISGEWTVPLDADVVLVHGQNGAGKTSLLSALELAATGTISYLDHVGDDDYRSHLHHRGRRSGQVTLETSHLGSANVGTAFVSDKGVEAQRLLDDRLSSAFVERCFLPQATLGRLFEVYAPKGAQGSKTPLIRFVKEVLGLDSLDALIDGLYASAHVRRIEKLSRVWQQAEIRSSELQRASLIAVSARNTAQANVDRLVTELAARLGTKKDATPSLDEISRRVSELVSSRTASDSDIARLHEVQLRLDAVESTLEQHDLLDADPSQDESELGLEGANARFSDWEASRSAPLRRWFEASEYRVADMDSFGPGTMLNAIRREIQVTETTLEELQRRTIALRDRMDRAAAANAQLRDIQAAMAEIASERTQASTSSAAAGLASALVSILDHLADEVCPVCDQDFLGEGSLREHVVAKAAGLDADAARLLELESRRSQLETDRAAISAELVELESWLKLPPGGAESEVSEPNLVARLHELRSLEVIAETGMLLSDEVARIRDRESHAERSRSLLDSCIGDLNSIAEALRVDRPTGLIAQRLAALRASVRMELNALARDQEKVGVILRLQTDLEAASGALALATERVPEIQAEVGRLESEISEARRRKDVASGFRRKAETIRTATVTTVFDERLNGSWARIFGALVPSEPFVPQFKKIPAGTRHVTVEVETIDRDGKEGATPAAMLSQGNLNTAALALFTALHFAVPAELPWLIFDDPVQSMDDLHVSNFAALVKQLTRRNGRQVVIAVHERELFDYLALELAPASPEEELLTVVLDRTYGETVLVSNRVSYRPDTALTPVPAA